MEEAHTLHLEGQTSYSSDRDPSLELEEAITQIWQEVFRLERVERDQNFFELGGNSLLAMDLAELLAARWGLEVPVLMLFLHPTIRELTGAIAEGF